MLLVAKSTGSGKHVSSKSTPCGASAVGLLVGVVFCTAKACDIVSCFMRFLVVLLLSLLQLLLLFWADFFMGDGISLSRSNWQSKVLSVPGFFLLDDFVLDDLDILNVDMLTAVCWFVVVLNMSEGDLLGVLSESKYVLADINQVELMA